MKSYKVTMDKAVRNTTIIKSIPCLLGLLTYLILLKKQLENPWSAAGVLAFALILVMTYLILYLSSPVEYRLTDDELVIKRNIGNVIIPLNEIQTVNIIDSSFLLKGIRTSIMNSGLFGYMGLFSLKGLETKLYTKRLSDNILITLMGRANIVISPNDIIMAIDLIEAVENRKQVTLISSKQL